jgi:hypothetical protein
MANELHLDRMAFSLFDWLVQKKDISHPLHPKIIKFLMNAQTKKVALVVGLVLAATFVVTGSFVIVNYGTSKKEAGDSSSITTSPITPLETDNGTIVSTSTASQSNTPNSPLLNSSTNLENETTHQSEVPIPATSIPALDTTSNSAGAVNESVPTTEALNDTNDAETETPEALLSSSELSAVLSSKIDSIEISTGSSEVASTKPVDDLAESSAASIKSDDGDATVENPSFIESEINSPIDSSNTKSAYSLATSVFYEYNYNGGVKPFSLLDMTTEYFSYGPAFESFEFSSNPSGFEDLKVATGSASYEDLFFNGDGEKFFASWSSDPLADYTGTFESVESGTESDDDDDSATSEDLTTDSIENHVDAVNSVEDTSAEDSAEPEDDSIVNNIINEMVDAIAKAGDGTDIYSSTIAANSSNIDPEIALPDSDTEDSGSESNEDEDEEVSFWTLFWRSAIP